MTGPFETQAEAFANPDVRRIYEAMHASPHRGVGDTENLLLLERACEAASVQLGDYDRRILRWLAGWEAEMCVVVAGLITRAAAPDDGKLAAIRALLDAFDWERDDRQYALERIEMIALGDDDQ